MPTKQTLRAGRRDEIQADPHDATDRLRPKRFSRAPYLIVPGLLAVGAGLLFASRVSARPVGNPRVPEPARPIDVNPYLGRWYEIARYDAGFERDCEAVTADYSVRPDGLIHVVNTCHEGGLAGPRRTATAKAKIVPGSGNAKLKVAFFGPFYFGDYWILDRADDYTWAIVGEPSGKYLWLLSREPTLSTDAKARLIVRAQELGYDTSMLRMTLQPRMPAAAETGEEVAASVVELAGPLN